MYKKTKNKKSSKKDFISLVVHQLLGPLSRIHLYLEAVLAGDLGELTIKQKEYLREVYQGSLQMVRLVDCLYNILHLEKKQILTELEPININYAVNVIIAEANKLLKSKKKCKFLINTFPDKTSKINIDISLLRNVLYNLFVNSIWYNSGNKCEITIGLVKRKNDFVISVRDNGIGIAKEEQKHVFEKFFRSQRAVKMFKDGNGLGLHLAKLIVEKWGGKIWFESEKNKGTVFYITIPKNGMKKATGEYSIPEAVLNID